MRTLGSMNQPHYTESRIISKHVIVGLNCILTVETWENGHVPSNHTVHGKNHNNSWKELEQSIIAYI